MSNEPQKAKIAKLLIAIDGEGNKTITRYVQSELPDDPEMTIYAEPSDPDYTPPAQTTATATRLLMTTGDFAIPYPEGTPLLPTAVMLLLSRTDKDIET